MTDYTQYVDDMQRLAVMQDANGQASLAAILPAAITYAELRIYRKFDFLATRTTDITKKTTRGIRSVQIPTQFVVVEGVSLVTPANTLPTVATAKRVPLLRMTRQWIDTAWPVESLTKPPTDFETYYAIFSEQEALEGDDPTPGPSSFLIAPTPDGIYYAEITGTFRPAPISASNPVTFLSIYMYDLFLAATMIWISGYQKSYGQQADDPKLAMSWETQFELLAADVDIEEMRKKAMSQGQSPFVPSPLAGIPRPNPPPSAPPVPGR